MVLAEVMVGAWFVPGAWITVRTNVCVVVPAVFVALTLTGYEPSVLDPGVPANVAVPLALSVKEIPLGSDPDSVRVAVGVPNDAIVALELTPTVNVAESLEMTVVIACSWPDESAYDPVAVQSLASLHETAESVAYGLEPAFDGAGTLTACAHVPPVSVASIAW
jgi:hypothetical protein